MLVNFMSAARKRLEPANERPAHALQRMTRINIRRAYWNGKRTSIVAVLAAFAVLSGFASATLIQAPPAGKSPGAAQTANTSPPEQTDSSGIIINASELNPPENGKEVAAIAKKLPTIIIRPQKNVRRHSLPPTLEISDDDDRPARESSPNKQEQAATDASFAQAYARQGDTKEALRLQHLAVELDPANMLYRLALAILYDRADAKDGAAMLYKQVVLAYDARDASLPRDLDIENVRRRLLYLVSTGSR